MRVKEGEDYIGLRMSDKVNSIDVHEVEMPEGQKKEEYQARRKHQWAETMHPNPPELCGRSILRIGIDHTHEHTNCKNLKKFSLIPVNIWFKYREEILKNSIPLWNISEIEPPEPCEQAPCGHEEQTNCEFEHTPPQCTTA